MTPFSEFKRLVRQGNVIPLVEPLPSDTETPVSLYLKIRSSSPFSFLLESVEGGRHLARYSFLGFDPFMVFTIRDGRYSLEPRHDDVRVLPGLVRPDDPPLEALKTILGHLKGVRVPGLPRFIGGAVGYLGYECAGLVERIPAAPDDGLDLPDATLMFFDVVIVVDNVTGQTLLVSSAYVPNPDAGDDVLRAEYDKAAAGIEHLKSLIRKSPSSEPRRQTKAGERTMLVPRGRFLEMAQTARRYIGEGDVFQVVLSQRIRQKATLDAFQVYRNLRRINPSPYMYFLAMDDLAIAGCSPEMLVRVDDGMVQTRPIAGTRRRGKTAEEDQALEQELLRDPKERAEHLMLVDLGRNDLGRICSYGTVSVPEFMAIERYSHVMHIVSEIRGTLRAESSVIDALFACFPAGTLTGAPKVRAMEIIAQHEPFRRGIYGGAVAYMDFTGNLDSCIAIRTVVAKNDAFFFQAGAGVVHDSDPEREYEETLEKLDATLRAFDLSVQ